MRVLDLSTDVAGRFASKLFAASGAEVVRPANALPAGGSEAEAMLARYVDAGKTVAHLDEQALRGRLDEAEIVFTSWDRGSLTGLATSLCDLLTATETRVHVTTSTYGMTGPYAQWRGGSLSGWAAGGYAAITGEPGREPLIGPETLCDHAAGYYAALAAEAALLAVKRGGGGRHIDISTVDTMLSLHQTTFSRLAVGDIRRRTGRLAEVYPLTVRPCANGYVSIGVVTNPEFDRFCIAIERPDLAEDERFADPMLRLKHHEVLDEAMAPYLVEHSGEEIVAHFQACGVASAEVFDAAEIMDNPQLVGRGFVECEGEGKMPGNPVRDAKRFAKAGSSASPRIAQGARPLEGITVVDLTTYWAGPMATRLLADLGADVIWIERPKSRIDFDVAEDGPMAIYQNLYQWKMCRHKNSVVFDLETEEGRSKARHLAMQADVLVENFRPGVADKLGMGAADLCAAHPGLVYVSLSGFGADGPWRDRRSFGPNIEACSSILSRTGYVDGEPLRLGHALPDGIGGIAGALAALRGLREREASGLGGWFDISQLETYAALAGEDILMATLAGQEPPRAGNRSHHGRTQGIYRCEGDDAWLALCLADDTDRRAFAKLSGLDAVLDTSIEPDRLDELIGEFASGFEPYRLAQLLQDAGIEAIPVLNPAQTLADPHLQVRGFFAQVQLDGKTYAMPGTPLRSDPPMVDIEGEPPLFGAATQEVLERFGYMAPAIAEKEP